MNRAIPTKPADSPVGLSRISTAFWRDQMARTCRGRAMLTTQQVRWHEAHASREVRR